MALSEDLLNKTEELPVNNLHDFTKNHNFYSILDENKEIVYGMVLKDIKGSTNKLEFIPFFQKNQENKLSLNNDLENMIIDKSSILSEINQDKGLNVWKELIKENDLDPELTIKTKSSQFIKNDINDSVGGAFFNLKNQFDKAFYVHSNILKNADKDASFEDVFDEIYNNVKNSPNAIKKGFQTALKEYEKSFENKTNISIKEKIEKLVNVINVERKQEDLKFMDDISTKFKDGSLNDEDVIKFLEKYNNQKASVSEIITDFVEYKKQELNNIQDIKLKDFDIQYYKLNDIISIRLKSNENVKGKVIDLDNDKILLRLPDGKEKSFSLNDEKLSKITKLNPGQKFTIEELKEAFINSSKINWDSISLESKLSLLKNEPSQLFKGTHQVSYNNDFKEKQDVSFKLIIKRENGKLTIKPIYKNKDFKLDEFEISGQKLNEEQIQKLKGGEQIKFEVFNKDGVLQSSKMMKFDSELNRVSFGVDKGKDFAVTMKKGNEQKFYMKATKLKM